MAFTIVIPARYASTRFPGKPLHPINGRPMVLHTADRARESSATAIVVATDDERIRTVCANDGLDVEMTKTSHPTGTDRIAEVADTRQWADEELIVGLQGDEPATSAAHLDLLAHNLSNHQEADVATLCMPMQDHKDYFNPNRVKVVCNFQGMALYFSRSAIPAQRKSLIDRESKAQNGTDDSFHEPEALPETYLHVGLYAYRRQYLKQYQQLVPCAIESEEQLEQLRVLYYGGKIHVGTISGSTSRGVDHPDDIALLETKLGGLSSS